ncbi:MAG: iron-sulfur cluster assembly accessory protein [Symploca sp. SIO3C6]|uniref:Iron-sulfur cluster assembly accessory protein n=1 Tax=Symploca sp. SIO1C4 TaxID=2607765 RepID=A0A6B3NJE2_9CYAN|nr:iron-sulfur cluster assembly accessory protein [Symploca sp. SIO3C6]NER30244.1 iron-sulfur cluster assembly accessory protein [Symploca sp. SIO1C4]NET05514.1 iron-sulfur cluster assembly accessory protein [Symploca sp. SIO2B6]NET50373.1 iron-sulfur cluster assembly accessory protein [Merismopedia sp. SIO2A8]
MIQISQAAVKEIKRLQSRHQNPQLPLRLSVRTGGCVQLYYTLEFDSQINSDDCTIENDGISVLIDSYSSQYLKGLTLDFSEDLMGGGFRFQNPNAAESCGCGNSFRLESLSST